MPPELSIPNVELGREIGSGSFGRVCRGRHRTLDVNVAVKLIDTDRVRNIDAVLNEARLMARLDHPNLLRIYDAGQSGTSLYLVLELMDATSTLERPLTADRAVDLARQLLAGLQALHEARVLHRDLKPANCLVRSRDGRAKLADLGIAVEQSIHTGRTFDLAGTLPFMAPELFESPPRFSPASDLYALGRTLQCLVLERDPFPDDSTAAVMAWVHQCEPSNIAASRPDLPAALARLIDRLCARDPTDRPQNAAEAIASLGMTVAAPAPSTDDPVASDRTAIVVGSWVLGAELMGDANFQVHAATHVRTGSAARIALVRARRPLSDTSSLILASAERASRLDHPGIASVIDWGQQHDGRAFVVTRAQGVDVETLVRAGGPLDEVEALEIGRSLADALAYLHAAGLVYQVVSPLFAVVSPDARSVQLAWPLFCVESGSPAQSADSSLLVSVPRYAPLEAIVRPSSHSSAAGSEPRRAAGDTPPEIGGFRVVDRLDYGSREGAVRITERADLHGLGELLYFMIAGQPICDPGLELPALVYRKTQPVRLRDVVPAVLATTDRLVTDLTAADPAKRPASAAAVRDRIDRILSELRPAG